MRGKTDSVIFGERERPRLSPTLHAAASRRRGVWLAPGERLLHDASQPQTAGRHDWA